VTPRPLLLLLGLVLLFLYLPVAILVALSFNDGGLPTAWTGFSVRWYGELWANAEVLGAARNSLLVAALSTLIATALGTLLALGVEMRRRRSRTLETLIFAPMVIPDIVLAIALLSFFTTLGLPRGLGTIVLSHVVFNLAFVCAVVRARLRSFDWSVVEAAEDLGSPLPRTLLRVVLPILAPAILAGALLAFTLSVDEFIIAFFTAGAGRSSTTLPMQIYAMIRFGVTPDVNALATLVLGLSLVLLVAAQRLNREALTGR
jgi:spermidine/putrescine transport system permease protein